jgi:hypothetical protein
MPALYQALEEARTDEGAKHIVLKPGLYRAEQALQIRSPGITIESFSGNPFDTIIEGIGMKATKGVDNLIRVSADHFYLRAVTLRNTPNHLVQVAGEQNASYPIFDKVVFLNSYEQMLKVSYNRTNKPNNRSIGGVVRNSIFQYTANAAPNYYTGGVDALGAAEWVITNSLFQNIASPDKRIAQHAVHFWTSARDNKVIDNVFINNDRSIGFGMNTGRVQGAQQNVSHRGGEISGNVVYHAKNGAPFADVGIILEASSNALIEDNWVFMEHDYPNAIEYRFAATDNVLIQKNKVNKRIQARNGGTAKLINNDTTLRKPEFVQKMDARVNEIKMGLTTSSKGSQAFSCN